MVRTRIYVVNIEEDWNSIGNSHGEFFGTVLPVTSIVEVRRLTDLQMLVEIEADAIVDDSTGL